MRGVFFILNIVFSILMVAGTIYNYQVGNYGLAAIDAVLAAFNLYSVAEYVRAA